jgi:hypothetical protein
MPNGRVAVKNACNLNTIGWVYPHGLFGYFYLLFDVSRFALIL